MNNFKKYPGFQKNTHTHINNYNNQQNNESRSTEENLFAEENLSFEDINNHQNQPKGAYYSYTLNDEPRMHTEKNATDLKPEVNTDNLEELAKEQLCLVCPEKKELEDKLLRSLAEMENYKKRLKREKEESTKYAAEAVLSGILPSLDNLDLALSYGKNNEACKDLVLGIEISQKLLFEALANHGLTRLGKVGEVFNPEYHEALNKEENLDIPSNHISQIYQHGYKLKDRLLRPAKVIISS